jgi:hypothetical protein
MKVSPVTIDCSADTKMVSGAMHSLKVAHLDTREQGCLWHQVGTLEARGAT